MSAVEFKEDSAVLNMARELMGLNNGVTNINVTRGHVEELRDSHAIVNVAGTKHAVGLSTLRRYSPEIGYESPVAVITYKLRNNCQGRGFIGLDQPPEVRE